MGNLEFYFNKDLFNYYEFLQVKWAFIVLCFLFDNKQ